jgi:hypothetical protein
VAGTDRSPNYPSIGLEEAIKDSRLLWDREQRTWVPPSVAATAWGYKSLSGPARQTIASLKQFGLLQSSGNGVALTDLAVEILHQPPDSAAWQEAVMTASVKPPLFRDLVGDFNHASNEALKAYLITKRRFSEDGSKRVTKAFRETMSLVNRTMEGYTEAPMTTSPHSLVRLHGPRQDQGGEVIAPSNLTRYDFGLYGGIKAEVRFVGGEITPDDIDLLKDYLDLQKRGLKGPQGALTATTREAAR